MADWVLAVERAYVAAASSTSPPRLVANAHPQLARANAAAAAIASRFLAVGTPRSMSFVFDVGPEIEEAALTLEAHRTWFAPIDIRCARAVEGADELVERIGGRAVTVAEALAADIVNVHGAYVNVRAAQLRRGTHVNVLGPRFIVDDELLALATVFDEERGLPALAAGLVDGRQLDELTVFFGDNAPISLAALAALDARPAVLP